MPETSAPTAAPTTTHRITWWVYAGIGAGRERIRRTSTMRSTWDYDATCSCGWDSRTGGALERAVREALQDHKAGLR